MKYLPIVAVMMLLTVSCGGRSARPAGATSANASAENTATPAPGGAHSGNRPAAQRQSRPVPYTYRVVKSFPHDTKAYTQGLLWHEGFLYEGTGQYGQSELRKVDPSTGQVIKSVALDRKYFGEGIVLLGDKIYQLTWNEGWAFVWDAATFRQLGHFSYDGEGWGITTDGEKLYMTDGSHRIFVRDPVTFDVERIIEVTSGNNRVRYINELEWVEGEIWANLYTTMQVVRIDPETGNVKGVIDFHGIQSAMDRTPDTAEFNGIAYDPVTGNIYVTGKNWNKLYQVEVIAK